VRAGLALIVIILNVAALPSILGGRMSSGRKLAWCAAVVLLPFIGAVGWLSVGRTRLRTAQRTNEMAGHA
jgi:hypothetical protein